MSTTPPEWIAEIPSSLLFEHRTKGLRQWLAERGRGLSLLHLDAERRRRNTTTWRNP